MSELREFAAVDFAAENSSPRNPARMPERTRSFKVVTSLVVTMSATSALVSWLDTSVPVDPPTQTPEQVLTDARALVSSHDLSTYVPWQRVDILSDALRGSGAPMLAALPGADSHFQVGLDGRISRTSKWVHQEPAGAAPSAIQITVKQRNAHAFMTRVQWQGLRALITAIHEEFLVSRSTVPVHWDGEWADTYGLENDEDWEINPISPALN